MNLFRKIKLVILSLLFPAMFLLAENAVFNWHIHKQADGRVMVHAHPYQKSGNSNGTANHHHSAQDCFSLQHLLSFFFLVGFLLFLALIQGKAVEVSMLYSFLIQKRILCNLLPNRAPPLAF